MTAAFAKPLPRNGRVRLQPIGDLDSRAWRRVAAHFRDHEIAFLNGTPPNRMPLWLLRRVLRADARRHDRATFGIYDELDDYIGTVELYDIRAHEATLGIIIGERSHWGRGYGPEAIECILRFGFLELGLERVKLHTFADNPRAQAAFRKVGFRELRRVAAAGGRVDVQMELVRSSWRHGVLFEAPAFAPREEAADGGA
jgi:RimJ/RimL family protein N-acetyltransferase